MPKFKNLICAIMAMAMLIGLLGCNSGENIATEGTSGNGDSLQVETTVPTDAATEPTKGNPGYDPAGDDDPSGDDWSDDYDDPAGDPPADDFFDDMYIPDDPAGDNVPSTPSTPSNPTNPTEKPSVTGGRVLEVGYGKGNITPKGSIPMTHGMSTSTEGKLELIALAFRDEAGEIYIHVVTDLSWGGVADTNNDTSFGVCDMIRRTLKKELNISADYVTVSGTHNHSQVLYSSTDRSAENWRNDILLPQAIAAVSQAIADLSPARLYIGRTKTERLTFVRRYWLSDGSLYDGFTGKPKATIVSHETKADEEVQLVKFTREGKKDILMINWQSHADAAGDKGTVLSPDYPGPLRWKVEQELGVLSVFCQGACGNLATFSRISSENKISGSGWSKAKKVGEAVAEYVIKAWEKDVFTEVKTGFIHNERISVLGETLKFDSSMLDNAKKVQEFHKTAKDNYETAAYAQQFGIESIYHANSIVNNATLSKYKYYELNIISIGDVAFTTLPMEFFDTTGKQIKNGSPYEMTLLQGYSCSKGQYVPDIKAAQNGGYESYKSYFVHGTAEIAVEHYLDTLNKLHPVRFEK